MRNINRLPGRLAHTTAVALTFVMTILLTLTALTWQMNNILTNRALHGRIATDSAITTMQMETIEKRVKELAEAYSFQPETAMQFITAESLEAYNREAVEWWTGLMQADPVTTPPEWDVSGIEQAVREDELFKANTAANMRRSTARDLIAYEIGQEINRTVLPVRADILAIVMPKVLQMVNVPAYMGYLALAPKLCAGASLALALLILLVMHRRASKAGLYIGAGLAAAGVCVVGVCAALGLLGVGGMIAEISTLLAAQVRLLAVKLMLNMGLFAALALAVGMALIGLHQADMRRLRSARGAQA
ncbi:MAG: hypothetical protein E7316_10225 [Clostridiales bacterium]|nr:hypothetical protein [Clostridiales bacterium]